MSQRSTVICRLFWLLFGLGCTKIVIGSDEVVSAAEQLYPGHVVLQLATPVRSSSVQAQLQQVANSSGVLVVLGIGGRAGGTGGTLVVDTPLKPRRGLSLVLATPSALATAAAAAEADEGAADQHAAGLAILHLPRSQLLVVQCRSSKSGTFIEASEVESLQLLGLSVQGCKKSAVIAKGAARLQLQGVELVRNNHKAEEESGGALQAVDVELLLLSGVVCSSNKAVVHGGCVSALRTARVIISSSTFTYNMVEVAVAKGGGGAVAIQLAEAVTISNCSFAHNTAHGDNLDAGAAYLHTVTAANISSCSFVNNTADLHAGALYGNDVLAITVSDSNFTRNGHLRLTPEELEAFEGWPWVFAGGGIAVDGYEAVNMLVQRCRFLGNAAESGGGISVTQWGSLQGLLRIQDCFFTQNEGDLGGAVFMNENMGSTVNVSNCLFLENRGHFGGGAMAIYDSDATVKNCTMDSNWVESEGGAMHVETEWAAGTGNSMNILGARFINNTSGVTGGALVVNGQALRLASTLFERNTANEVAGAISVLWAQTVVLSDVQLLNNTARNATAGGMRVGNTRLLCMQDVLVQGNKGPEGAGMHLQSILNASLSNTTIYGNTASRVGGGLALQRSHLAISSSSISHNTAQLGGGLAADSSHVAVKDVVLDANSAALRPSTKRQRQQQQQRQQQDEDAAGSATSVLQFASMVYAEGSAGALLLQRSTLSMQDSSLTANAADWDAGALLLQQPGQFSISSTTFASNVAREGMGGALVARGGGPGAAPGWLSNCSFVSNTAAGSGGSAVLDSGIGLLEVQYKRCVFSGNTAGLDGGGVAATGPTVLECAGCDASSHSAARMGGWLSCLGCKSLSLQSSSSSRNQAAATGGSVSCNGCGMFQAHGSTFGSNAASDGGALAVHATADVGISSCSFQGNQATAQQSGTAQDPRQQLLHQLPPAWQALYTIDSAAGAGSGSQAGGSGGAMFVAGIGAATLLSNLLTNNSGSTGGAVYASVGSTCGAPGRAFLKQHSSSSNASCQIQLANVTATGNTATLAGGVLYTSTPQALQLGTAVASRSSSSDGVHVHPASSEEQRQMLQQLAADNSVGNGSAGDQDGYGPGAASSPMRLSLLRDPDLHNTLMLPEEGQGQQSSALQQQQQDEAASGDGSSPGHAGRRLQQFGVGRGGFISQLGIASDNTIRSASDAVDATSAGVTLDPVCPALGATVLEQDLVSVDRFQVFSLPVHSLDQFDSQVTRGPGSDWMVALKQPQLLAVHSFSSSSSTHRSIIFSSNSSSLNSSSSSTDSSGGSSSNGPLVQLLSAARGRLSGGGVVLEGLSIAAPPGSELSMKLTAHAVQPGIRQVLSTGIIVRVRPCLPGQTAVFSNTSTGSSSSRAAETCYLCAAPSFSFTAYTNASSSSSNSSSPSSRRSASGSQVSATQQARFGATPATGACQRCPPHGLCIAGMVMPTQGCYQPHPRSATIHPCPHTEACTRDANAVQNLQGYQCAIRGILDPYEIDARPFTALQCSKGYWGPFCSCCYRPGRNVWLSQPGQLGFNLQDSHQALRMQGFTIASRGVSLPKPQNSDYSESFGRSSGRCTRCPHLLLAWLGFLLARLLDLALIALMALLWVLLGVLANSPAAAALEKLKQQQAKSLRFGDRVLMSKVSMTLRHASSELVRQGSSMLSPRLRRSGSGVGAAAAASAAAAAATAGGRHTLDDSFASFTPNSHRSFSSYSQRQGQAGMPPKPPPPKVVIGSANSSPQPASARSGMNTPSPSVQLPHALLHVLQAPSPPLPHHQHQQLQQYQPHQLSPVNSEEDVANIMSSPFAAQAAVGQQQQQQSNDASHGSTHGHAALQPPYSGLTINPQQLQPLQQQPQQLHGVGNMQLSPFMAHAVQGQQVQLSSHSSSSSPSPLPSPSPAAAPAPSPALMPSPTLLPGALLPTGHLASSHSITWSTAVKLLNQQQQFAAVGAGGGGGIRPGALYSIGSVPPEASGPADGTPPDGAADEALPAEKLALLLIAVRHLACMAQVLLDGAQIAALILTQDLMFRVPAWTAVGLSAVLLTQASTWQWVAFECLLPGSSKASGIAVQAVVVMLLPVCYTSVLLLVLTQIRKATSCCTQQRSSSSSSSSTTLGQQQQQPKQLLKLQLQQQYQPSPSPTPPAQSRLDQLPPPAFSSTHSLSFGNSSFFGNSLANGNGNGSLVRAVSSSQPANDVLSPAPSVSPFVTHARNMALAAPVASIGSGVYDVLPPVDQNVQLHLSGGAATEPMTESPFVFALPAYESTSYSGTVRSEVTATTGAAAAAAALASRCRPCAWLRTLWLLVAPQLQNTWALLASLAVAAMAYCYTLYSSVVVGAFSCMPLAGKPTVPGEVHLTARVWVPDMQLQCYTGQHIGVAAMAAFIGIPMLAAYWLLLVVLAMPQKGEKEAGSADGSDSVTHRAAAAAAAAAGPAPAVPQVGPHPTAVAAAAAAQAAWQGIGMPRSRRQRLSAWWQWAVRQPLRRALAVLAALLRPLERLVGACQRATVRKGVDGTHCVGLDVWNQEHRWWWIALREWVKLSILITVVVNSMHASYIQAPLVLLVVLVVAALIWKLQPGCSTSMNWLLYIMYCMWQLLALLVLVLAMPGVNGAAFGGVLLAMLCVVMANAFVMLGSLVWRCLTAIGPSTQPVLEL